MTQRLFPGNRIRWKEWITPQVRAAFFGAVLFGLFCHGTGLLNKLSHHDDVDDLFRMGSTVRSGRWMLHVFQWLEGVFYGTGNTSLPLFNGMISILCVGMAAGLLVSLMQVRKKRLCALVGGIMAAFPAMTSIFAYMFTSHPYLIALLMTVAAAFLICGRTAWWIKVAGTLLAGAAIGIYQAFLPVFVTILLMDNIRETAEGDGSSGILIRRAAVHFVCAVGALAFYLVMNRFFLNKFGLELSSYQGISGMGQMTLWTLLERAGRAYREFFSPSREVFQDVYPGTLHTLYEVTLGGGILLAIRTVFRTGRESRSRAALLTILFVLVPLAGNLIYVMAEDIHSLMIYGQVMPVILLIWLCDRLALSSRHLTRAAYLGMSLVLAVTAVMYARFDNQCYLKDTLHQQEAISYYTTLITRIKSLPGYRPEMEVYFVNTANAEQLRLHDPTVYNIDELDFIRIMPYWHNSMEYTHAITEQQFIRVWCGADFFWSWKLEINQMPEVQAMPPYPADGSLRIIDDVVVVKF